MTVSGRLARAEPARVVPPVRTRTVKPREPEPVATKRTWYWAANSEPIASKMPARARGSAALATLPPDAAAIVVGAPGSRSGVSKNVSRMSNVSDAASVNVASSAGTISGSEPV